MYKAVFFDLVNTLVRYDPPPEEHQGWALRQLGIEVSKENLRRGFWISNDFFTRQSAHRSIEKRSAREKEQIWLEYELAMLRGAGIDATPKLAAEVLGLARQLERRIVLFEDTVAALGALRDQGLTLGLVSNLDMTLDQFCPEVDLAPHLDFVIVSHEVGFEKPHPEIFEVALERAGAEPSEAIMVGDQYHSDIVGAIAAGIKPLWLDRDGVFGDIFENGSEHARIGALTEILEHL
ncbi:MAG: HAD-IA family hydrolase [Chloroflexi bacterium]|nr:HAD-IA family hydrolase [Chloroflexota bacterium]